MPPQFSAAGELSGRHSVETNIDSTFAKRKISSCGIVLQALYCAPSLRQPLTQLVTIPVLRKGRLKFVTRVVSFVAKEENDKNLPLVEEMCYSQKEAS